MDYISIVLSIFFTVAAFGCFGMAALFFYKNRHKQGIAFSTLMFVCVVVAYAPQLDSIKGGFVDAKFNRTLNQANDIIARLTSMAQINSKVAYTVLAWGGRLGGPYARDKQLILEEIGQQMADLKISDNERREISKKFVQLVAVDLAAAYAKCISALVDDKYQRAARATTEEMQKDPTDGAKADLDILATKVNSWRQQMQSANYVVVEQFDLPKALKLMTPDAILSDNEREGAKRFENAVAALFKASAAKGNLTTEASDLIDSLQTDEDIRRKTGEEFGYSFR